MALVLTFFALTAVAEEPEAQPVELPGISVNMADRYVDLAGRIVLREGLLELIACREQSKEHESIIAIEARPQHVHLSLLMIGLESGHPGGWRRDAEGNIHKIEPQGDRVRVSLVIGEGEGETEQPIEEFVIDTEGNHLPGSVFIFAGSQLIEQEDEEPIYSADETGNAISLVSFGDELLAWPEPASTSNATLTWQPDTASVPPLETPVRLRVRPVVSEDDQSAADDGNEAEEQGGDGSGQ
jgi:hypothetical protein